MSLRISIIGAGIGGLALAQALLQQGHDVHVYDKDSAVEDTGGYRLHLTPQACAVLRRGLDPELYQALLASAAGNVAMPGFRLADQRLRTLVTIPNNPAEEVLLIGRIPLRTLLATGLEDRLHFGYRFETWTRTDAGVSARFADGTSTSADLLVGADGSSSGVATQLAGAPRSRRLGVTAVAGMTPAASVPPSLLDTVRASPLLAIGANGVTTFLTVQDPHAASPVALAAPSRIVPIREDARLIWGVNAVDERWPPDLRTGGAAELLDTVQHVLSGWPPALRRAAGDSDLSTVNSYAFTAADPDRDLTPWEVRDVTALGDAIHAMPPTGGQSASTAIRDAGELAEALLDVGTGRATLAVALSEYQRRVHRYAPEAIRESLQPVAWMRRLDRFPAHTAVLVAQDVTAAVLCTYRRVRPL